MEHFTQAAIDEATSELDSSIVVPFGKNGQLAIRPQIVAAYHSIVNCESEFNYAFVKRSDALRVIVTELYGKTKGATYDAMKVDKSALRTLALADSIDPDQIESTIILPFNRAYKSVFGALPKSISDAATRSQTTRGTKPPKAKETISAPTPIITASDALILAFTKNGFNKMFAFLVDQLAKTEHVKESKALAKLVSNL